MDRKIKRIDVYNDDRFDSDILKQHGAFIIDDKYKCSFRIINHNSAIVLFDKEINVLEIIDEFRFYSGHIINFYNEDGSLIKSFPQVEIFDVNIEDIQPSQFFVDVDKVNAIESFTKSGEDIIIPLIKMEDRFISLDGHTRLFYAVSKGYSKVKGYLSETNEYIFRFVEEAIKRNIFTPNELELVSHKDYEIKWHKFCDDYFMARSEVKTISINELYVFKEVRVKGILGKKDHREVIHICTDKGDFILKRFHKTVDKKTIIKDTKAIEYLGQKHKKLAPNVIKSTRENLVEEMDDNYLYLMEYIKGRRPIENPEELLILGKAVGELHKIEGYEIESNLNFDERRKEMYKRFSGYDFKSKYDEVVSALPDFHKLKQCFIHTDVGNHNCIINEEGKIVFVDFDDAGIGSVYIDAGYPLITQFIRYGDSNKSDEKTLSFNEENARAFYTGYFTANKVSNEEIELIFQGAVFMQLMYMPEFGQEANIPMWNILKFALDNKARIIETLEVAINESKL